MSSNGGKIILIIDDENLVLNLLEDVLHLNKFEVLRADSGEQALSIIEKTSPDLAIADISMPGMNGYEVIEKLREKIDIPIIVLTGHVDYTEVMNHKESVPDTFMQKPIKPADLIDTINYLLNSSLPDKP
ncbi:MAG: response regulator [Planctomycetota bacterium]